MSDHAVTRLDRRGMIALRGDLAAPDVRAICEKIAGVAMPAALRIEIAQARGLAWMSPDEILLLVPHGDLAGAMKDINSALQGTHFMAENLSDARASFRIPANVARDVIAKNSPADMHPHSFGPGDFRRTRLGQVAAALWMNADETIDVICFASVADYVHGVLQFAADMGPVDFYGLLDDA